MEQEIACPGSNGKVVLRAESIPFSRLADQSKLFLQYQDDPISLKKYFPSAVQSHTQISERIPEVLENYTVDRDALCDALEETNRRIGAGEKTFENIARLRQKDAVAVVTGQQTGLFTGPLYTIYKALSAVRAAECLCGRGFNAVPVFWAASEDHDFEEVSTSYVIDGEGGLERLKSELDGGGQPVGDIKLDGSIETNVEGLFEALKQTEFSTELRELVRQAWKPGKSFSEAFEEMLAALLSDRGLVILDPQHRAIKKLASPISLRAVEKSAEILSALKARTRELGNDGFEAQVAVEDDYFPMFWLKEDGVRVALRQTALGTFRAKDKSRDFTAEELSESITAEPWRFSPAVLLRPIVQDYLLPTICYFGGGAEISYFAQNSEVYRVLDRPVTTILHRRSFTVIEAKHSRTLKRYNLQFTDLFRGLENLLPTIVDRYLNKQTARTFAEVEENIDTELNRLDRELSEIDPTLAESLANRRRKIVYHIGAIRAKYHRAQLRRDEMIHRQIDSMFNSVLPNGVLQERVLNTTYFINQYGPNFIDWIYRAIDLDDNGHRVIYL